MRLSARARRPGPTIKDAPWHVYGAAAPGLFVQPPCAAMAAQMVEQAGQGVAVTVALTEADRDWDADTDAEGVAVAQKDAQVLSMQ